MRLPSIMLAGVLAIASAAFVSAKSYDVVIDGSTMAGNVQIPAGEYHLKLQGDQAVFTDVNGDKTFTAPVTMETGTQKFDQTAVFIDNQGTTHKIQSIELGGSKTKLEFK